MPRPNPRQPWTRAEEDVLRASYADAPTEAIAQALGRGLRSVYGKASALGLVKSAEYLAGPHASRLRRGGNVGAEHRFRPGQKPWNAGMKGWKAGGRSAQTRFRPGRPAHLARNYQPIGATRLDKGGNLVRKITDDPSLYPARRWVAVSRLVWEAAHGPIPAGHIVVFLPGRHTAIEAEITLDRLELITRRENMLRNSLHRWPKELADLVQLRACVTRQINRRSKA